MNILTDEERSDLAREMVKGMRSVDWLCEKLESAVLSKLAEQDVEPVADVVWFDPALELFTEGKPHKIIDGSLAFMDTAELGTKLFTEAQLLAAQQRTAEACAKAVGRLISGDGLCADDGVWIHDCAEAIRNGDWREYL